MDEANGDHFIVTAKADTDANGKLTYIINSRGNGYHQVKGRMISFEIKNANQLISKEGK